METHAAEEHVGYTGAKVGMWLFLLSEILLFGGIFFLYAVYRYKMTSDFRAASEELNLAVGTMNTLILLTSSLFMAIAVSAIPKGNRTLAFIALLLTIFLGLVFLGNKYFEWTDKISHGIYPGSPRLRERSAGEILFFGLYFTITGLHGLHIFIGIGVLVVMTFLVSKGKVSDKRFVPLENAGLYWHLVDIIWIFIFPLFYLIS
jgi:cytochrome c oxidase subunit 3